MLTRIIITVLVIMPAISFPQQADEILSGFLAAPLDETVYLRWTILAGNTCEDTYIERSADGIAYDRIGIIGGICGSPDQSITYDFTDTMPLVNQEAYYRLQLGFYGYTSPKVVEFIRYNENGFLLTPNPFSEYCRLAFANKDGEEHELSVSDMSGKIVMKMNTSGEEFIIDRLTLPAGVYYFRVFLSGESIYAGKLIAR